MRTLHQWLDAYGESHQNPTNIAIHKVCVPLIMFCILGMLWHSPWYAGPAGIINPATTLIALCLVFYLTLSYKMFLGMLVESGLMLVVIKALTPLVQPSFMSFYLTLFVIAWIFQFVGHKIEGKKPSFFDDLVFLFIGPLWTLNFFFRRLNISV